MRIHLIEINSAGRNSSRCLIVQEHVQLAPVLVKARKFSNLKVAITLQDQYCEGFANV